MQNCNTQVKHEYLSIETESFMRKSAFTAILDLVIMHSKGCWSVSSVMIQSQPWPIFPNDDDDDDDDSTDD